MKKNRIKNEFLEQLRKLPIVQVACEKVGISRNSVYRWKITDKDFSMEMENAITEGDALVNDMSENQLLTLIKEKNYAAISFWLRHRNPRFKDKLDVTARIEKKKDELTPEQEITVRKALELASLTPHEELCIETKQASPGKPIENIISNNKLL